MKDAIVKALTEQAEARNCRILLAVESGSRAWGFASPDSDYDIRAVYVKPLDWYLGIEEPMSDTWEAMLPGELDVSAWDLRKALRQFQKSNASFLEWLGSPIVYSDCGLIGELKGMIDSVFNPTHVAYHYASMFRHAMEDKAVDGTIGVKKLCYALRANAAVDWVVRKKTMPPTVFASMLEELSLTVDETKAIDELLALKSQAGERDRILPDARLCSLLADRYDGLGRIRWREERPPTGEVRRVLEDLFRKYVKGGMP